MSYLTTTGMVSAGHWATDPFQPASGSLAQGALECTAIPVDLSTSSYRTLYRVVTGPVETSDILIVNGQARVTNDCGYNIGVAWHYWVYSYTNPLKTNGPWWRISHWSGENVTPDMHHMPTALRAVCRMPEDWPDGDRAVVVMRADAHSTAWKAGDTLTVDAGYGQLEVEQLTLPPTA